MSFFRRRLTTGVVPLSVPSSFELEGPVTRYGEVRLYPMQLSITRMSSAACFIRPVRTQSSMLNYLCHHGRPVAIAILVLILSGCSTLPTIVPDMARRSHPPIQLEGVHGALSVEQSRKILDRLKARGQDTNIFERHLAVEEAIVGSPLVVGNKVVLLEDGPATFQAMFAAIRNATNHINMETYILDDDEVGRRFANELIKKQRQGVQVNLIYDSVGTLKTPHEFFQRLADAGVRLVEFNPVNPLKLKKGWDVNQRDHRKLLIVDGETAFLGGINISGVYSSGSFAKRPATDSQRPWRDIHFEVRGPVVAELQKLFIDTWNKQHGGALAPREYFPPLSLQGKEVVRAIGSSADKPYSLIHATLISAITSAETSVHLTNAYFVPDPQLLAALKDAARRGVDVKIILPSSSDSSLVLHAGHSYYDELLSSGVRIYERRAALLHAKTAAIDGVWSTIGSTNLDWRSFLHNDEINAVVLGASFGVQMETMFEKDLAESDLITLERWRQRSLGQRIKERAARLWSYWL